MLWWLTGVSAVMFVATLLVIPILVVRIPEDYFAHTRRHRTPWAHHHPAARALLHVAKNTIGALLLVAGIAMLVLPGQGILTIVIALVLLDIPGKYRFERWLVSKPAVWRSIAWLRARAGHEPLILEDHPPE